VAAEEALYGGDNPEGDVDGAKTVGMRAAWVNEHGGAFPGRTRPDLIVNDLIELKALLEGVAVGA
jgi:putative hydrolase of the HAD superfamily